MSSEQREKVQEIEKVQAESNYKKDMNNLKEIFLYDAKEWQLKESDKADRD